MNGELRRRPDFPQRPVDGDSKPDRDDVPRDPERPLFGHHRDVVELVVSRLYPSAANPEADDVAPGDKAAEDRALARARAAEAVISARELTSPDAAEALVRAYDVARTYTAPVVVKAAHDMLPDLRAETEINPERVTVFVGRDGHSLAAAVCALDLDYYEGHCKQVVLSRALVESAVQDLEGQR